MMDRKIEILKNIDNTELKIKSVNRKMREINSQIKNYDPEEVEILLKEYFELCDKCAMLNAKLINLKIDLEDLEIENMQKM